MLASGCQSWEEVRVGKEFVIGKEVTGKEGEGTWKKRRKGATRACMHMHLTCVYRVDARLTVLK